LLANPEKLDQICEGFGIKQNKNGSINRVHKLGKDICKAMIHSFIPQAISRPKSKKVQIDFTSK
jgi:hypothetical protein